MNPDGGLANTVHYQHMQHQRGGLEANVRSQKQPSDVNMQFEMLPQPKRRIHGLKLMLMLIPAMGEVAPRLNLPQESQAKEWINF